MESKIHTASMADIMNLTSTKGSNLTYKEMKIECIIRGMPFREVLAADFFKLMDFLFKHLLVPKDVTLVDQYDDYLDKRLRRRNKPELIHNSLRLGYLKTPEITPDGKAVRVKKEKVIKEKKPPRVKDEHGLIAGTAKSYTYQLQAKGKTMEQTKIKVKRKFPDSNEGSVKIWYNKAKKGKK